ncbi:hypothetical protein ACOSQ2_005322 [Xanthoceras sorbifolium]
MGSDLVVPQSSTKPLTTPTIPTNDLFSVDVLELSPRSNRGKPPKMYSPDNSKTMKYPIAHYVSSEQLPCAIQVFVN